MGGLPQGSPPEGAFPTLDPSMLGNQWLTSCCPTRSWSLAGNRGRKSVRTSLLAQLGDLLIQEGGFWGAASQNWGIPA